MKKLFTWIVFTLLYLLFSITIVSFILIQKINNPNFVKGAFDSTKFYPKLLDNLNLVLPVENSGLSNEDINKVIKAGFDENYIKSNSETIIDNAYGWINGQSQEFKISLDLSQNKAKALDKVSDLKNQEEMKALIDNIPSKYEHTVANTDSKAPANLKKINQTINLSFFICFVLFLLTIVLLWKDPKSLLKKHGSSLVWFGLPLIAFCLIDKYFAQNLINQQISNYLQNSNIKLDSFVLGPINYLISNIRNSFLTLGIVTTILGALLFSIQLAFKKPIISS